MKTLKQFELNDQFDLEAWLALTGSAELAFTMLGRFEVIGTCEAKLQSGKRCGWPAQIYYRGKMFCLVCHNLALAAEVVSWANAEQERREKLDPKRKAAEQFNAGLASPAKEGGADDHK